MAGGSCIARSQPTNAQCRCAVQTASPRPPAGSAVPDAAAAPLLLRLMVCDAGECAGRVPRVTRGHPAHAHPGGRHRHRGQLQRLPAGTARCVASVDWAHQGPDRCAALRADTHVSASPAGEECMGQSQPQARLHLAPCAARHTPAAWGLRAAVSMPDWQAARQVRPLHCDACCVQRRCVCLPGEHLEHPLQLGLARPSEPHLSGNPLSADEQGHSEPHGRLHPRRPRSPGAWGCPARGPGAPRAKRSG